MGNPPKKQNTEGISNRYKPVSKSNPKSFSSLFPRPGKKNHAKEKFQIPVNS